MDVIRETDVIIETGVIIETDVIRETDVIIETDKTQLPKQASWSCRNNQVEAAKMGI